MDDYKSGYGNTYGSHGGGFGSPGQFGGAGGFDRGGEFGASQNSASPGSRKPRDQKTLRAVLIKSVLGVEHGEENMIDGKPVNQITLVAQIVSVDEQNTALTFLLDDSTGQVNGKLYTDSADDGAVSSFRPGQYVRVYGNMNSFANQKVITIFKMLPVTDHNEITFHHLEAINHHLQATKGRPAVGAVGTGAVSSGQFGAGVASSSGNINMNAGVSPAGMGLPIQSGMGDYSGVGNENFTPVQQRVLHVFENSGADDAGVDIAAVSKQLPGVSMAEIRQSIEFLCGEGHLYSTIDEDHYRSTSS